MSHQILSKVDKEVVEKRVTEATCGDLSLFKYSHSCQFDCSWNEVNKNCRGVIFHRPTGRIVCRPFSKFFNAGEVPSTGIDLLVKKMAHMVAFATEKLDGSMVSVFYWDGKWRATTSGAFASAQAVYSQDNLLPKYSFDRLPTDLTYVFEMISPWDRKVVDYKSRDELIALAAFENKWEEREIPRPRLESLAREAGFQVVKRYHVEDPFYSHIPEGEEGYVVRFDDGFRVKVKSKWYFRIHKLLDFISVGRVLELLREGSLTQIRDSLPPYLHPSMDDIVSIVRRVEEGVRRDSDSWWAQNPGGDFKTQAEYIKTAPAPLRPILFCRMRGKDESKPLWDAVETALRDTPPPT